MVTLSRRWKRSWNNAIPRWIFGTVTIAAVALATIFGGQRYLYCRAMGEIMARPTCECAVQRHVEQDGRASLSILNDCFDVRLLDRLLAIAAGGGLDVAGAPFVAVLPAVGVDAPRSSVVVAGAEHPIRAGPYSPTGVRAQLMVFLT